MPASPRYSTVVRMCCSASARKLLQAVQRSQGKDLRVLSRHYMFSTLALALARNDDDFRLAVDRALSGVYGDPQFGVLYSATFGPAGRRHGHVLQIRGRSEVARVRTRGG